MNYKRFAEIACVPLARLFRRVRGHLRWLAWSALLFVNFTSSVCAEEATSDGIDLVILGATQPVVLRLHVQIDGVSLPIAHHNAVSAALAVIAGDEKSVILEQQAVSLFTQLSKRVPTSSERIRLASTTRADLSITLLDLLPQIDIRQRLASRGAGPALFPLLDADRDGRLSQAELAMAEASLACRDFNDDGLITQQELLSGPQIEHRGSTDESILDGIVILLANDDGRHLTDVLLQRYDQDRDGRLSLVGRNYEVRFSKSVSQVLDRDQNDSLDRQELMVRSTLPPDVVLSFALGRASAVKAPQLAAAPSSDEDYRMRRKLDGGYKLYIGELEVDVRRNNRDPAQSDDSETFEQFDANTDGFLDDGELKNTGLGEFVSGDQNAEHRLSKPQWEELNKFRIAMAKTALQLDVSDQGQDLFTLLDQNFDRVLTVRELKAAVNVLKAEDLNADGFLGGDEIPQKLVLEISRGAASTSGQARMASRFVSEPKVKSDRKGPPWFQKMDRNGDGDLTLIEFLGDRSAFASLDLNGDGLLSAEEALDFRGQHAE